MSQDAARQAWLRAELEASQLPEDCGEEDLLEAAARAGEALRAHLAAGDARHRADRVNPGRFTAE